MVALVDRKIAKLIDRKIGIEVAFDRKIGAAFGRKIGRLIDKKIGVAFGSNARVRVSAWEVIVAFLYKHSILLTLIDREPD